MKKLALFMLLSVTAMPLVAMISDAEYAQALADAKAEAAETAAKFGGPFRAAERGAQLVDMQTRTPDEALEYFVRLNNLPVVQYLIEVKGANPKYIVPSHGSSLVQQAKTYGASADLIEYLRQKAAQ